MIRILHVIDSLDLGGAQTALINLIRYADRERFHHEVAAMHGRGLFAEAFERLRIPTYSLSARRWPPEYLWKFPELVRKGQFDIVQTHLFGSNWIAKPLAAVCGVRIRYSHDQCNDAFRSGSPLATLVDRLTNRFSTRIFSVSESITDFLKSKEQVSAEKIVPLPNSVDRSVFVPPTESQRSRARQTFGIPEGKIIVGAVGRMVPQKDFQTFVLAARELQLSRPDLVFVVFGSGPEEGELRKLAAPLGDRFRFAGIVSDRPAIYHALDAQVLPSRFEGLPMTLLEAMASGVPVIASNVDGVREIASHGKDAVLIEPGDVHGFAVAIDRVTRGGFEVREQIVAAEALMAQRFDAIRLSREMHSWYEKDVKHLLLR